jgi:hypothetical protein
VKLTVQEAFARAQDYDRRARNLRAEASSLISRAGRYERWATKWRNWADDEYGDVPYPGTRFK